MATYRSAWTTLTGRVFVPLDEIEEYLMENCPRAVSEARGGEDECSVLDFVTVEEEKKAFEALAKEKINACLPNDEPMKLNETEIDLSTYR